MKCPVCKDATLVISDRQGIEIDYCPDCRGVWLDRGELDKIIERTSVEWPSAAPQPAARTDERYQNQQNQQYPQNHNQQYSHKHKKKSLLSELFDF